MVKSVLWSRKKTGSVNPTICSVNYVNVIKMFNNIFTFTSLISTVFNFQKYFPPIKISLYQTASALS